MRPRFAIVVIATERRKDTTFLDVVRSCHAQRPDELVVVADFPWAKTRDWEHFVVAPLTMTTIDALVKRDVGWVATESEMVMFLCDDHRLGLDFVKNFHGRYDPRTQPWDFIAPWRYTVRGGTRVSLPMGKDLGYCGGHAGIFKRWCGNRLPWSAAPHHPNWDVLHSHQLISRGARLMYADDDLAIEDIEPGAEPWK